MKKFINIKVIMNVNIEMIIWEWRDDSFECFFIEIMVNKICSIVKIDVIGFWKLYIIYLLVICR